MISKLIRAFGMEERWGSVPDVERIRVKCRLGIYAEAKFIGYSSVQKVFREEN